MGYTRILKRAWEMAWRYRALWIFGALLALTTINGFYFGYGRDRDETKRGVSIQVSSGTTIYLPGDGLRIDLTAPGGPLVQVEDQGLHELRELILEVIPFAMPRWILGDVVIILIAAGTVLAGMIVIGIAARYVAEAALIRMVDETERTRETLSVGQGLRLGFSRTAWRLFLVDLVIRVPVAAALVLLFLLALAPLLLWTSGSVAVGVVGTMFTTGLLLLSVVAAFAVSMVLSLFIQVVRRACATEGLGVLASVRRGLAMVKGHLREVVVVWLIWLGIRLVWMVVMVPVMLVLLPVTLLFIGMGLVLGGVPAVAVGGLLSLFLEGAAPWIVGGIVGVPILILVMIAPMLLVSGLVEVFKSSTWTLAYRDLRALESKALRAVPERGAPVLGATQPA